MPAVGLQVDHHLIAAIRLDGSARSPEIRAFFAEPFPTQPADSTLSAQAWRAEVIDEFLKRHKLPRDRVYLAVSSADTILRQFSVPFTQDDQIRKTIRFQTEAHIH